MKQDNEFLSEEEMKALAAGVEGTQEEQPQTQPGNGNVDFASMQQQQQTQSVGMPTPQVAASPEDTLMPTSEQTVGTSGTQVMDLEKMEATKPTIDPQNQHVPNNTHSATQAVIQSGQSHFNESADGTIQFQGPGIEIDPTDDGDTNEPLDPAATADTYIESMGKELVDPNVRKIIDHMEEFVPQLKHDLGGTPELDQKYAKNLEEKAKLDPIYQGNKVAPITRYDKTGKEVTADEIVSSSDAFDENVPASDLTEVGAKYREAVVHIDKFNKKDVNFTEEEKAKLSHSTKIVLEEIEELDLRQISRRKMADTAAVETISPLRANTHNQTTVPLLSSGLVASFDGCPPLEVMGLGIDPDMMPHQKAQIYADFLYKHLKSTSIGDKITRDEFDKISYNDMEMMFYAIVCATYPDMDYLPVICRSETCNGNKEYQHYYSTRSLLRVERLHEDAIEIMGNLADSATTLEARRLYANSPAMQTKTFRLPENRAIVVVSSTSIAEFIKRMIVMQDIPQEYIFAGTTAIYIKQVLIPPTVEGKVVEDLKAIHTSIEDTIPIIEFVQGLSSLDLSVIQEMIGRIQENVVPEFGLFDLTCPHCGEHKEFQELNPSDLLFFKVEQEMNRPVEVKRSTDSSTK